MAANLSNQIRFGLNRYLCNRNRPSEKWWAVKDYSGLPALHPSGHLRYAMMFKFAPGKFVEPSTIGLKDSRLTYQVFINQSLTVFVHLQCARKRKKARKKRGHPCLETSVMRWTAPSIVTASQCATLVLASHKARMSLSHLRKRRRPSHHPPLILTLHKPAPFAIETIRSLD